MAFFARPERQGQYRRLDQWHLELPVRLEETRAHSFDFSGFLAPDSLTISSVANEESGPTLSGETNTTTTVAYKTVGYGTVESTLTLSDGSTRIFLLSLVPTLADGYPGDYSR